MHDTYIQSEKEFAEEFPATHDIWLAEKGNLTISEYSVPVSKLKSHIRTTLIKQFQVYVKELDAIDCQPKDSPYDIHSSEDSAYDMGFYRGRNEAKKLAIEKANNFIKYLEQR